MGQDLHKCMDTWSGSLIDILEAGCHRNRTFMCLRKNCQPGIFMQLKYPSNVKAKYRMYQTKIGTRATSEPKLQEILKEAFLT